MSPLRRMRVGWPGGGSLAIALRVMAPVLLLLTALLLARSPAAATSHTASSQVCVGPVPVGGACTTTTSTTSSRTTTQPSTTAQTTTSETETETTTGQQSTTTGPGTASSTTAAAPGGARATAAPTPRPTPAFPAPPPPLPPPPPGTPPTPPESAVQRIVLVPAISGPVAPGDTVAVQATLETQRGTEIFAVPNAPVTFSIVSAPGGGAEVSPAQASSGDSGVAVARVRTGALAGDTVIAAASGAATAQLSVHTDVPVSAAAQVTPPLTPGTTSESGGHRLAIAALVAALACASVLVVALVRRPRQA